MYVATKILSVRSVRKWHTGNGKPTVACEAADRVVREAVKLDDSEACRLIADAVIAFEKMEVACG